MPFTPATATENKSKFTPASDIMINNYEAAKPKEPSYLNRVLGDYRAIAERTTKSIEKNANDFSQNTKEGDVVGASGNLLRSGLRSAGAVAEGAFAPIIEIPIIKDALGWISNKVGETDAGKKLAEKIQQNPEKAQDIFDAINIATLGTGKAATQPVKEAAGATLKKTGKVLEDSGEAALKAKKDTFVRELIKPVQTKAVKEAQVARTSETGKGILKKSVVEPTPAELKMEGAIKDIPDLKEGNTFQQNYNVIKDANVKEAQNLEAALKANDFAFEKKDLNKTLKGIKKNLSENPSLVGDNERIADKLINKFNKLVETADNNGSSLLQVRKDFDSWVKSQKGSKIYDPNTENAFSIVNRELRQGINDFIDQRATDVNVKESLSKQSSLYGALDNIKPKAAVEADSAIGRTFQKMANAVGIKNKTVQIIAATAGIGGLGAAATFAPAAAAIGGLGFLLYKGGKLIMKPQLRMKMGELLQKAGNAITPEERALVEGLIKSDDLSTPQGILTHVKENDGITVNLKGDMPESGYVVSPSKATELKIPVDQLTEQSIADYKTKWAKELKQPNAHFGIWKDGDNYVLDVSKVVKDFKSAMDLAKKGNQDGIFDLNNFETILRKDVLTPPKGRAKGVLQKELKARE